MDPLELDNLEVAGGGGLFYRVSLDMQMKEALYSHPNNGIFQPITAIDSVVLLSVKPPSTPDYIILLLNSAL